jgi:predicted metal-dependent phosphotriesterase family hydrolase
MTQVETIRGPVDVADLGTTLMHEHVFVLNEEIRQNYPGEALALGPIGLDPLRAALARI